MNTLLASLMFFTRLPWWRLWSVPKEAFEHVVDWWPLMGWLTGGVMALTFCLASLLGFSPAVAALLAIAARLLLTGALHEDGLADFCDGFGGGVTRERTLLIMKDSHIGTYGVLGLILYFALLWTSLTEIGLWETLFLPEEGSQDWQWTSNYILPFPGRGWVWAFLFPSSLILLFDVAAKCAASMITGQLPYARTEETAKNQVVYAGRSPRQWVSHALRCTLALALPIFLVCLSGVPQVLLLLPVAFVVEFLLVRWMRRRLGGYTGDCCGALFLLCELSLYLALPLLIRLSSQSVFY